jgi:hypothetical protein
MLDKILLLCYYIDVAQMEDAMKYYRNMDLDNINDSIGFNWEDLDLVTADLRESISPIQINPIYENNFDEYCHEVVDFSIY